MHDKDKHQSFIKEVFQYPEQKFSLKRGEILLHQGQENERLHLLVSGRLSLDDDDHIEVYEGGLIGLQSFFSPQVQAHSNVTACEDSELLYIEAAQVFQNGDESHQRKLMEMITYELRERNRRIKELEKQQQLQNAKLHEIESLALLGKLSAGIAHELNNAVSVLSSGSHWLEDTATELLTERFNDEEEMLFLHALEKGRPVACSDQKAQEVQEQTAVLVKQCKLSFSEARQLARLQLPEQVNKQLAKSKNLKEYLKIWELGANFSDMKLSSTQAIHILNSMRELGTKNAERARSFDLVESFNAALSIVQKVTKNVTVKLELPASANYYGIPGEFIQVWINIIQNGCSALDSLVDDFGQGAPQIVISLKETTQNYLISISNNGPKISDDLLPMIFNPDVTTRKNGLSFGLGLGLTLVKRIVSQYFGDVSVQSDDHLTTFTITLPKQSQTLGDSL